MSRPVLYLRSERIPFIATQLVHPVNVNRREVLADFIGANDNGWMGRR